MTDSPDRANTIRLETPRLILREHRLTDLEALHGMLSDVAVTWYLPDMYRSDIAETEAYLRSVMRDSEVALRTRYNLIVEARGTGEIVGSVGLHVIDSAPDGAHYGMGYFVRPDRWNRGYATEAACAALSFVFGANAWRVSASCLAENIGSRRVLEKCGMRQEGLLQAHTWHDGKWKDCAVYGILKEQE